MSRNVNLHPQPSVLVLHLIYFWRSIHHDSAPPISLAFDRKQQCLFRTLQTLLAKDFPFRVPHGTDVGQAVDTKAFISLHHALASVLHECILQSAEVLV